MRGLEKPIRIQSTALTRSARGQQCTVRSSACNGDPETTVFAHLRGVWSLGIGTKPHDFWGVFACGACHDCVDGRRRDAEVTDADLLRALYETQSAMARAGLLAVKGAA